MNTPSLPDDPHVELNQTEVEMIAALAAPTSPPPVEINPFANEPPHPSPENADAKWIADLIRNEYDKAPDHYRMGDSWDDGAERIAAQIIERFGIRAQRQPDPCPYCNHEMHGSLDCEKCHCGSPGRPALTSPGCALPPDWKQDQAETSRVKPKAALTPLHLELLRRGATGQFISLTDDMVFWHGEMAALRDLHDLGFATHGERRSGGPALPTPSVITEAGRAALTDRGQP